MKNQAKAIILTVGTALLVAPISAYAHPGRTDANGGHTCRKNCAQWGLKDGEYHYHNKKEKSVSGGSITNQPSSKNNSVVKDEKQRAVEEQRKIEEAQQKIETEKGQTEGQTSGETDFQTGKNNAEGHLIGKSETYKQAFTGAYSAAWSLAEQKKAQFEKGKEQGLAQETMDDSQVASEFKANFTEGFQSGNKERTERIEKEQSQLGEKAGRELVEKTPGNSEKEGYVKAYEVAYEKGYQDTKKKVEKEGYTYAIKNYDLKVPSKYEKNESLKKWFTEGFKSNKKAAKIRKEGYKKGNSRFSFFYNRSVPSKYKDYKGLYGQAIKKGESAKKR
ncbi:hypothetical protein CON22_20805 [Bacillus cereus]|nr:hypothetical protein CON22_20805 [Bacillus cereus]